MKKSQTLQ